jgi:hypothetical protein
MRTLLAASLVLALTTPLAAQPSGKLPAPIRSVKNGPWSDPTTWEGGTVPGAGARVQVREGHRVVYDISSDKTIRFLHVAGTLTFASDRDTLLDVGLIMVQPGDDASESGFDCDGHAPNPDASKPRPALEVGTPEQPVDAKHTALIRLVYQDGMDKGSCPAIVCCGGRMDFHGAPLSRTWVQLGAPAKAGDTTVTLAEPVSGWKAGDRIILTGTTRQNKSLKTFQPSVKDSTQTEEHTIKAVDGARLTLDKALAFDHVAKDVYRGAVANLSRNVVVESADPQAARGHTMYHRNSAGAISYAEFRHLGMPATLGRYSLHFHLCGETMRGSYVLGASIWDSGNRWLTVHGTNYLIVRDCVGYKSLGHGFFLEDGTEVYNVFDRNLAVQAFTAKPLPKQVLPYDPNDGAGFWWANCLNTFTRNVACECDEYGYFFQVIASKDFDPVLAVQQPDGTKKKVDIRTLPFVRFEDNETNCQRRHGFNLGGSAPFGEGVAGVGPDVRHPFVIKHFRSWNVHWAIHPCSPSVLIEDLDIHQANYGIWRPVYKNHAYKGVKLDLIAVNAEFAAQGTKPKEGDFPKPLDVVDDMPPQTVITHIAFLPDGKVRVRGTTSDNGVVKRVLVNKQEAKALRPNFAEWEVMLSRAGAGPQTPFTVSAHAEDAAGNVEPRPHIVTGTPGG